MSRNHPRSVCKSINFSKLDDTNTIISLKINKFLVKSVLFQQNNKIKNIGEVHPFDIIECIKSKYITPLKNGKITFEEVIKKELSELMVNNTRIVELVVPKAAKEQKLQAVA
jgi:hypothetical protein